MQSPLEMLQSRLIDRGLPVRYVRRLIEELQEHWEDALTEELAAGLPPAEARARANRRMGEREELAQAAVEQFRQRTVLGRHPVMGVVTLAAVGLPLLWAGFLLTGMGGGAQILQWLDISEQSRIAAAILAAISHVAAYWICGVAAACCYLIGRVRGLGNAWTWTICGLIALVGSFNHVAFTAANSTGREASLLVAIMPSPSVRKLVLILAIAVLCEMVWKLKRRYDLAAI